MAMMMPASSIFGGGTPTPQAPQAPVQNWQSAANPVQAYQQYEGDYANYVNQNAAYQNALRGQGQQQGFGGGGSNPQVQAYMQYLSKALPSINNGIRSGTIQPGQALQNFQEPQSFGIPNSGFGGMMEGGSGGFDMNVIMQLLQRMGGGQGGGNMGAIFNGGGGMMNSISQMVGPMQGGWQW